MKIWSIDTASLLRAGDATSIEHMCSRPLFLKNDNFVVRPWAGQRLQAYKRLDEPQEREWYGESFELAAYSADEEACQHPSLIQCDDGSTITLLELAQVAGSKLLGDSFVRRYGTDIPLLPKILNIKQLLSMQTHPEGNIECYIIIDADEAATLYLGFAKSLNKDELKIWLNKARTLQESFADLIRPGVDQALLYEKLLQYFSNQIDEMTLLVESASLLSESIDSNIPLLLQKMKYYYHYFLSLMNKISVKPGDIIYNAHPEHVMALGMVPSAEVHALGNPENREILALEIRRPGPTFRLWDNVRFPLRPLSIDTALQALNVARTFPEEFFVVRRSTPIPGVYRSIETKAFVVEHIMPTPEITPTLCVEGDFHMLHLIKGTIKLVCDRQQYVVNRGQTVIIPAQIQCYEVCAADDKPAELIKICVP